MISGGLVSEEAWRIPCMISFAFIFSGLLFKIGIVPFHSWIIDVYQGAPSHITVFLVLIPKFTFVIVLIRLFLLFGWPFYEYISMIFIFSGLLSIVVGGLTGIFQVSIWRILGASSISNLGFCILALGTGEFDGLVCAVTNLFIYLLLSFNFLVFIMAFMTKRDGSLVISSVHDLVKIGSSYPGLTSIFILNNFALSALPPLPGFYAKLLITGNLMEHYYYLAAALAIFASALSTFFYLNLIKAARFGSDYKYDIMHEVHDISLSLMYFGFILNLTVIIYLPSWVAYSVLLLIH